jgi:hypothetical protein
MNYLAPVRCHVVMKMVMLVTHQRLVGGIATTNEGGAGVLVPLLLIHHRDGHRIFDQVGRHEVGGGS